MARTQINIRLDKDREARITQLRKLRDPIPSVSDLMRELVDDAYDRELGGLPASVKGKRK